MKYNTLITDSMELKLRNGYVQPVQIDKERCLIKGVLCFFKNMELNGGGSCFCLSISDVITSTFI